jgi:hypothetical protein
MNISLSQLLEESFQIAWEYRNGRELVDLVGDGLRLRDARQVAYDDVLRAGNLLATMHRRECLDHIIVSGEAHLRLDSNFLCRLLQLRQNASFIEQGCADFSSDSTDRNHSFTLDPRRASPSLRPDLSFRYTQAAREEIDDGGHIEPAFACVRGHAVFEFSDDIVELNGVGYWLKTGLGLRRDIAPLSAIAPPRVERDCVTGTASTASQRPCRGGKLFTVPPLEPKSHRIIIS